MEEFINTFEKGMSSDFSVLYQPDGTYRYLKNCQLLSVNGNNYTITDCMGNTKIFTIDIPYNTFTAGTPNTYTYQTPPMPIGFISFPDKLIVLSTNSTGDTLATAGYGAIGIIEYKTYGEGIQPTDTLTNNQNEGYVPLYWSDNLKFSRQHKVEGFAFPENEITESIYWTDYFNEPRTFNIANPIFTTYYGSGGLVVGQEYMVLEGIVEHPAASTIYYGPGLATGNVFTASTTSYTDKSPLGLAALVIGYFPYQLLAFTPSRSLGNMKFNSYGTGVKTAGNKVYFYRQGRASDNYFTSWSYGSSPIHVGAPNSVTPVIANNYENFVGAGTATTPYTTTYSIKLDLVGLDTIFDIVEVAVAEYDSDPTTPTQIIKVISTAVTGSSMTVEDTGANNFGTVTLSELTLFPAWILKCKTMATDKNYNLIGNLTEREEIDFDNSTITITQIQRPMPVHEYPSLASAPKIALTCQNVFLMTEVGPATNANPANVDGIPPYTQWFVSVGVATYNGVAYGPASVGGQVFTGAVGVFNWVNTSGTAVVRPCVSKNKYTALNGSAPTNRPDTIVLTELIAGSNKAAWDFKHPAIHQSVTGLWNLEKYRYGIMPFDLKGNPMYVRFGIDLSTVAQDALTDGIMFPKAYNAGGYQYAYLNNTGAKLSGIRFSRADVEKMSGFSVVRVERDKRIITQGLLMQCGLDVATSTIVRPVSWIQQQDGTGAPCCFDSNVANTYYSYLCPDALVNLTMTDFQPNTGILEEANWLGPFDYQANVSAASIDVGGTGSPTMTEAKFFDALAADAAPRQSIRTTNLAVPNEAGLVTDFGATGINFDNGNIQMSFVATVNTDTGCIGGIANPSNIQGVIGEGGRKVAVKTNAAFHQYGFPAIEYANQTSVNSDSNKILCNFVVEKPVQYGGTGASALANNLYVQCGHFQPINASVIADCNNTNNVNTYTYLEFNDVEVWGGDAFTCLIDYGYALYDNGLGGTGYSLALKFPCQNNVNYSLRRGRTIMNSRMHLPLGGNGVVYNDPTGPGATVRLEGFEYNPGYSSNNTALQYPAFPVNYIAAGEFKTRIRFAGPKIIGELENSFRTFLVNNYHDLAVQYGEINNIRERDTRVIVWHNKAVVTVPILERQLLSASTGADTTIGTGGVVDRFDAITSAYGNQHQHGLTETEFGFVWFDMRKKAFMVFDINAGIIEESKIGGLSAFFNEVFLENLGNVTETVVLNSPTFDNTSDRPLMGVGIIGVYDPKLKMTYLTFKFNKTDPLTEFPNEQNPVAQDFTIGYYHLGKMFIGFFDFNAAIHHNHNQIVISANNPSNPQKYYGAGMESTDFIIGDIVGYLGIEYVCIVAVTIANFDPSDPTNPVLGTTYWTATSQSNQLWVLNQPTTLAQAVAPDYQFNKFFGIVRNNELKFIVNPKNLPDPFSLEFVEFNGNETRYTDITYSGSRQTASDLDIQDWDRNYFFIDSAITANVPMSTTGRITDNYVQIDLVKKNYSSNPTILTGLYKVLQYVSSFFELKR